MSWPFSRSTTIFPARPREADHLVGESWKLEWNASLYRPGVTLIHPTTQAKERVLQQQRQAKVTGMLSQIEMDDIDQPGVYRLSRTRTDGSIDTISQAFNVASGEGDLTKIDREDMSLALKEVDGQYRHAADFTSQRSESRYEAKDGLICLLALVFLGEQLLAYRLSFHRA